MRRSQNDPADLMGQASRLPPSIQRTGETPVPLRIVFLLPLILLIGCATPVPRRAAVHVTTNALLTQRAVLSIHGRQFTLNGYLALSETGGMRLIMTHSLGQMMADVLVKPDGAVFLMRPTPVLRRVWVERYVAGDMKLFLETPAPSLVFTDRYHTLELRTVETKPGLQPAELFDETKATTK